MEKVRYKPKAKRIVEYLRDAQKSPKYEYWQTMKFGLDQEDAPLHGINLCLNESVIKKMWRNKETALTGKKKGIKP